MSADLLCECAAHSSVLNFVQQLAIFEDRLVGVVRLVAVVHLHLSRRVARHFADAVSHASKHRSSVKRIAREVKELTVVARLVAGDLLAKVPIARCVVQLASARLLTLTISAFPHVAAGVEQHPTSVHHIVCKVSNVFVVRCGTAESASALQHIAMNLACVTIAIGECQLAEAVHT